MKKKDIMYKLYVISESFNDATTFYIQIIEDAIKAAGFNVERINDTSYITQEDIVITVGNKMFFDASKKKPMAQINWFQGVAPEEVKYSHNSWFKKIIYYLGHTFYEWYALKHASLSIMVSDTMKKHYSNKYGFDSAAFIMPCFNAFLNKSAFKDKFDKPTFVYAGNLAGWQCFEETVSLFSKIKESVPSAKLTVYTQDQEEAYAILKKYNVESDLRYVPYQQLSKEIQDYKYGFLVRADDPVNNVATPTKMNTYLANAIIPIYSTVIGAFRDNLNGLHYAVPVDNIDDCVNKIVELENESIKPNDVLKDYSPIFEKYYSREYYISALADLINQLSL